MKLSSRFLGFTPEIDPGAPLARRSQLAAVTDFCFRHFSTAMATQCRNPKTDALRQACVMLQNVAHLTHGSLQLSFSVMAGECVRVSFLAVVGVCVLVASWSWLVNDFGFQLGKSCVGISAVARSGRFTDLFEVYPKPSQKRSVTQRSPKSRGPLKGPRGQRAEADF